MVQCNYGTIFLIHFTCLAGSVVSSGLSPLWPRLNSQQWHWRWFVTTRSDRWAFDGFSSFLLQNDHTPPAMQQKIFDLFSITPYEGFAPPKFLENKVSPPHFWLHPKVLCHCLKISLCWGHNIHSQKPLFPNVVGRLIIIISISIIRKKIKLRLFNTTFYRKNVLTLNMLKF